MMEIFRKLEDACIARSEDLRAAIQQLDFQARSAANMNRLEATKQIMAFSYSQAIAYTNVIVAAGYVAFFALWVGMEEDIEKRLSLLSGGLIALSAMSFVGFEVLKMIWTLRFHQKALAMLEEMKIPYDFSTLTNLQNQFNGGLTRVWAWTVFFTVVTGLGAGGVLVYGIAKSYWAQA